MGARAGDGQVLVLADLRFLCGVDGSDVALRPLGGFKTGAATGVPGEPETGLIEVLVTAGDWPSGWGVGKLPAWGGGVWGGVCNAVSIGSSTARA